MKLLRTGGLSSTNHEYRTFLCRVTMANGDAPVESMSVYETEGRHLGLARTEMLLIPNLPCVYIKNYHT